MKRLMSDEEFRGEIENAYWSGWNQAVEWGNKDVDFEEWFDATYGGPDCE